MKNDYRIWWCLSLLLNHSKDIVNPTEINIYELVLTDNFSGLGSTECQTSVMQPFVVL